uniref:Uncharacterized protein n=2 Tax=Arundo donax TaxID=35708 RepID=A0A0A9DM53_ARUDO
MKSATSLTMLASEARRSSQISSSL